MDQRRSIRVGGRQTSLQLEAEYWSALDEIGRRENFGLPELCAFIISRSGPGGSLASAVRVFVTRYFRDLAGADASQPAMAASAQPRA